MNKPTSKIKSWPFYEEDEIMAVQKVLLSGRVNYKTGTEGKLFEEEYAKTCDSEYALAVTNGTAALELALVAIGVTNGDEVIVPARTFIATASAVVKCGATPIVADIECNSQNMSLQTIGRLITPRTKAIIPVHLAGWPVDMDPIIELAKQKNIYVIEDCAQAHGAKYKNRSVGSIGDIGCFSFCQDKIISTGGEGGLVITNDPDLYKCMWSMRDHGLDYNKAKNLQSGIGFKWLIDSFSTNLRMTEMQSAIGRCQLLKLDNWVAKRQANANMYTSAIRDLPIWTNICPPDTNIHSYYKYNILLNQEALSTKWNRNKIIEELGKKGIESRVGACPDIANEAAFQNARLDTQNPRPNAAAIADFTLMLPVHPTLTEANISYIAENLRNTLKLASK
jgi:dTDP-4-amino-4,6-dideoxygalactose transaminase